MKNQDKTLVEAEIRRYELRLTRLADQLHRATGSQKKRLQTLFNHCARAIRNLQNTKGNQK